MAVQVGTFPEVIKPVAVAVALVLLGKIIMFVVMVMAGPVELVWLQHLVASVLIMQEEEAVGQI
jgi:hypothetical protein